MEDQQAQRAAPTDAAESAAPAAKARALAERARRRQALELQREQVLDQRTSNPHRRATLAAALSEVEQKLRTLDEEA